MIGIIGGYGDIGHNVVETLYGLGHRDLADFWPPGRQQLSDGISEEMYLPRLSDFQAVNLTTFPLRL